MNSGGHTQSHTVTPWDARNQELVASVHPAEWINPTPDGRYNLVVIGAGTAGLVSAIGAAGLGAKVGSTSTYPPISGGSRACSANNAFAHRGLRISSPGSRPAGGQHERRGLGERTAPHLGCAAGTR